MKGARIYSLRIKRSPGKKKYLHQWPTTDKKHVAAMADTWQCEPVFVAARALPQFDHTPDVIDLCSAAERVTGKGTITGAQRIRGLWRIYPQQKQFRDKLLLDGIQLSNVHVNLCAQNPFVSKDNEEKPATKLWISSIPLSVGSDIIEQGLVKLGCEVRSQIKNELARDKQGQLTRWLTGRRFVFITTPPKPLSSSVKFGRFDAELYHKQRCRSMEPMTTWHCFTDYTR